MTGRGEALRLLGVGADATEAEVRTAFRRKMMENHPDTAAEGTDDTMAHRLIDAYRLLADSAPRSVPDPEVRRVDEHSPVVRPVEVRQARAEGKQASMRAHQQCSKCKGSGVGLRVVTCPACDGDSVVTALDVRQVRVWRCSTCAGLGQVRALARCGACGGTGRVRS